MNEKDFFNFLGNSLAFHTPIHSVPNVTHLCFSVNPLILSGVLTLESAKPVLCTVSRRVTPTWSRCIFKTSIGRDGMGGGGLQELHSDCAEWSNFRTVPLLGRCSHTSHEGKAVMALFADRHRGVDVFQCTEGIWDHTHPVQIAGIYCTAVATKREAEVPASLGLAASGSGNHVAEGAWRAEQTVWKAE